MSTRRGVTRGRGDPPRVTASLPPRVIILLRGLRLRVAIPRVEPVGVRQTDRAWALATGGATLPSHPSELDERLQPLSDRIAALPNRLVPALLLRTVYLDDTRDRS